MRERHRRERFKIKKLVAAVIVLACIFERVEVLSAHQALHRISELNLTARTRRLGRQKVKHSRLENVAAGDLEARGRLLDGRLLDHAFHLHERTLVARDHGINDAILVHALLRDLIDRNDVAADFIVGVDHLFEAGPALTLYDDIGQQHGEGFIANDVARTKDSVTKAQRRLLAREARGAWRQGSGAYVG